MAENTAELVRQWLSLREWKAGIEEQLREVNDTMSVVADKIKANFLVEGTPRMTVDGFTVHVIHDLRVSAKEGDVDRAVETLRRVGLGSIVKEQFNTQTLKSVVKDIQKSAEMGDERSRDQLRELGEAFTIFEMFNLSARKAAQSTAGDKFLQSATGDN